MTRNSSRFAAFTAALSGLFLLLAPATVWAAGPSVHGRVLGHDEQGKFLGIVAGAKIEFQNRGGAKVAQTSADANGYYKIDLPPGEYLYKLEASGYRTEDAGRGMRLSQNEGYAIFNLALTKGQDDPNRKPRETPPKKIGRLRGRVMEKTPSAPIGIPEARIALRREGSRELSIVRSRATADEKHQIGDYEVTLEAGSYHASVMAAGFKTFTDPLTIEIKPGEETRRDFVLSRPEPEDGKGQGIRGVVTIVDSGATPPPLKIQIVPLSGTQRTPIDVRRLGNSAYRQDLAPGRYRVTASAEGFPTASSPAVYAFEGKYTVVNLALRAHKVPEPKTNVDVFVYVRSGVDKTIPLADASVSLVKAGADPATAREGTTDSTGHEIFPVTEAGEYVAEAHLKGYRAASGKGLVQLGQSHEIGIELVEDVTTPAEILLSVVVSDASNKKPLAGAKVLARHVQQTLAEAARGTTDAKGEVSLHLTRAGSHSVVAQLFGYEPAGVKAEVFPGERNRVAISLKSTLTPTVPPVPVTPPEIRPAPPENRPTPPPEETPKRATVTGYVAYRELTGQLRSVPDAKLVWERIALNQPAFTQFATTGNNGRYQIEVLPGHYQVRVDPPAGFERVTERCDITPGTQEKYFLVRRSETTPPPTPDTLVAVKGQVLFEASPGRFTDVANAEILFLRTEGVAKATSNAAGDFGIRLAEDRYRVYVRATGFQPLDTQADVRTGMSPLRYVLKRAEEPSTGFDLNVAVVERETRPVARAVVPVAEAQMHISQDGRPLFSGLSDGAGRYSVRVKPGSYTVGVGKRGYAKAAATVVVTNHDVTQQIILTREEGPESPAADFALTLNVVERPLITTAALVRPVAGAQVQLSSEGRTLISGVTNSAGQYSTRVKSGAYSVRVSKADYSSATVHVGVSNRDVTQQVVLTRSQAPEPEPTHKPTLTVRVARHVERPPMTIQPTGSAIGGAQVTVMRGSQQVAAGTTSAGGTYSIQLPPGSYAVKVFAQGYAAAGKVTTLADRDTLVDFQLDRTETGPPETRPRGGSNPGREPDTRNAPAGRGSDRNQLLPGGGGRSVRPEDRTRPGSTRRTVYVVEYRLNDRSPWIQYDVTDTQEAAQRRLFFGVEHGQIPSGRDVDARIRVETR